MLKLASLAKSPIFERAYKTFVEATAAQAALYTTVVPHAPNVQTTAAISTTSAILAIAWNLALAWATNAKSARLDRLAEAIDKAADARIAAQAAKAASAPVEATPAP